MLSSLVPIAPYRTHCCYESCVLFTFFLIIIIFYFLQRFLESNSRRHAIVRDLTNGTTPLIIAAKNGHMNCVEFLVDKCNANIEQVGSSEFRNSLDCENEMSCLKTGGS